MKYQPLSSLQVRNVIEGKSAAERIPVVLHFWIKPDAFGDRKEAVQEILSQYPCDIQVIGARQPGPYEAPEDDPSYRWVNYDAPQVEGTKGLDAKVVIPDWSLLDGIIEDFPKASYPGMFPGNPEPDGRYRLGSWWFCLFERHWSLRGMQNALMDYYTDPESVHRLFRALTDLYKGVIQRYHDEIGCDGFFMSDDIGTQTAPFFSPGIFREFYKPYYREIIEKAHALGMHFWLHTCGNVELFMPEFIEIGMDVVHPIQKYTMDERLIAEKFGKDICIWAGFDVQQVIPWGTPDEVRSEVRYLFDTYQRPEGRLMFTAGNAIHGDCPVPSLEALFDEAFGYGSRMVSNL